MVIVLRSNGVQRACRLSLGAVFPAPYRLGAAVSRGAHALRRRAGRASTLTRRDLPMPASPLSRTTWPSPAIARRQRRNSSSISSSRPTNGVKAAPQHSPKLEDLVERCTRPDRLGVIEGVCHRLSPRYRGGGLAERTVLRLDPLRASLAPMSRGAVSRLHRFAPCHEKLLTSGIMRAYDRSHEKLLTCRNLCYLLS